MFFFDPAGVSIDVEVCYMHIMLCVNYLGVCLFGHLPK